jgi:hypothetical protein
MPEPDRRRHYTPGKYRLDSPSEPKEQSVQPAHGQQRQQQHERFARQHKKLLAAIRFHRRQSLPHVLVQKPGNSYNQQLRSSTGQHYAARLATSPQYWRHDSGKNAEKEKFDRN